MPVDVSVVIPTRDRIASLRLTLASVLRQDDVDLEVVVVDDGSSVGISEAVSAVADPRVRSARHDRPRGPNAARNTGAAEASGRWIAFIDDDDLWAPDKLAAQLGAADAAARCWVYAGAVNIDDRLRVIHGIPPPDPEHVIASLPRYNPIPASASNVMIDAATFRRYGGFDERLRSCEEWELWLRLSREGPPAWVPRPLVAYRMHRSNAVLDVAALEEGARAIERIHGTRIDRGRFHRWIAQLCLRNGDRRAAIGHYARAALHGDAADALAEVAWLARQRLHRRGLAPAPKRPGGNPAWEALARPWLDGLATSSTGRVEGERT